MGMLSTYRRLYLTFFDQSNGRMRAKFDVIEPTGAGAIVAMLTRGKLTKDTKAIEFDIVTDPTKDPSLRGPAGKDGTNGVDGLSAYQLARQQGYGGTLTQWLATLIGRDGKDGVNGTNGRDGTNGKDGINATTLLGTITISEQAVVAISAGTRRIAITTPTAWNVAKGQDFIVCADALPSASYALHDAIATGPNTLSIGITTPALALLSSYSITARVRRLN